MSPFEKLMLSGGITGVPAIDFILIVASGVAAACLGGYFIGTVCSLTEARGWVGGIGIVLFLAVFGLAAML